MGSGEILVKNCVEVLPRPWLPAALFKPLLAQTPWNRVREERMDEKRENDIVRGEYTEGGRGVLEGGKWMV